MKYLGRYSLLAVVVALILSLAAWYYIDIPIAHSLHSLSHKSELYRAAALVTRLGDPIYWTIGVGVLLVPAGLLYYCQRQSGLAKNLFFFLVAMALAMAVSTGLKSLLGRYRPEMLFKYNLYGFHFLSTKFSAHSMPSGHTTRAFAAAVGLSIIFRRLTLLFVALAILVGASRLVLQMHYLSDVLCGALIGTLVPLWVKALLFNGR